jgi:hypothetical protein
VPFQPYPHPSPHGFHSELTRPAHPAESQRTTVHPPQVEIGAVLQFTSRVVLSDGHGPADVPRVAVSVRADVLNVATGQMTETNTFEFLFACKEALHGAELHAVPTRALTAQPSYLFKPEWDVPVIVPKTYEEAMAFLAARRRYIRTKGPVRPVSSLTFDPALYL